MAFARRARDFLRRCFAPSGDDVGLVVEASAPPADGGADDDPYRFELDAMRQTLDGKLTALKEEHEKRLAQLLEAHQTELAALRAEHKQHLTTVAQAQRRGFDGLNERMSDLDKRCDRLDSRVNSLREQQLYEQPSFSTYSVNYVPVECELYPRFEP